MIAASMGMLAGAHAATPLLADSPESSPVKQFPLETSFRQQQTTMALDLSVKNGSR